MRPLQTYHPANGTSDQTFHVFVADSATHVGPPSDPSESERIEWVPVDEVRSLVLAGELRDGLSLTGILRHLLAPS